METCASSTRAARIISTRRSTSSSWHCRGGRAGAGTEGENVNLGEPDLARRLTGGLKVRFRLAGEAYDDVSRDGRAVQPFLHQRAAVAEPLAPPAAPHPSQHRV